MKFQPCFLAKKRPSGDRKRGQPPPPQKGGLPLPFFESSKQHLEPVSLLEFGRSSATEGGLEILLSGNRPTVGAEAILCGIPSVEAAHRFAVREIRRQERFITVSVVDLIT